MEVVPRRDNNGINIFKENKMFSINNGNVSFQYMKDLPLEIKFSNIIAKFNSYYVIENKLKNKLELWDLSSGDKIQTIKIEVKWDHFGPFGSEFSDDGRYLLINETKLDSNRERFVLWDINNQRIIYDKTLYNNSYTGSLNSDNELIIYDGGFSNENIHIRFKIEDSQSSTRSILKTSSNNRLFHNQNRILSNRDRSFSVEYDIRDDGLYFKSIYGAFQLSFTNDGEWLATNINGFFDCSSGAKNHVEFTKNGKAFESEQYWDELYYPGLIQTFFNNKRIEKRVDLDTLVNNTPKVEIVNYEKYIESKKEFIDITVTITPGNNGLGKKQIYRNGRVIEESSKGLSIVKSDNIFKYTILLIEGDNVIKISCYDADNKVEGRSSETLVFYNPQTRKLPDLYVLSIGVGDYDDETIKLNLPAKDANDIVVLFSEIGEDLYSNVYSVTLVDDDARRDNIRREFKKIINDTKKEDTLVVFFSGHGFTENNEYYFLTQEADILDLEGSTLSVSEISQFTKIVPANKIVVLFDTCQSGDAAKTLSSLALSRGLEERKSLASLAKKSGILVFAASSPGKNAYEIPKLNNGIFTYSIIDVIKNKSSLITSDGLITVNRLMSEVESVTREVSSNYLGFEQQPLKYNFGHDFEIGIIE